MSMDLKRRIKRNKRRHITIWLLLLLILAFVVATLKIDSVNYKFKEVIGQNKVKLTIEYKDLSANPSLLANPKLRSELKENGYLVNKKVYKIKNGETVFSLLNRVCRNENIQIEYVHSSLYQSYYVKGIGYIYEFAAGRRSGWTYTVDGKRPDVGASDYNLKGGEEIVWHYTVDYLKEPNWKHK